MRLPGRSGRSLCTCAPVALRSREFINQQNQVPEIAPESVQPPHDHGVELPTLRSGNQLVECLENQVSQGLLRADVRLGPQHRERPTLTIRDDARAREALRMALTR